MSLPANIVWSALTGAHASLAVGGERARRYARGYSPIAGFANREHPDFDALAPLCDVGEHLYCEGWAGTPPPGWSVEADTTMFLMVWQGPPPPDETPEAIPLGPQHAAQALALAELTRPGPFGPRTIEMGQYFGVFEEGRLVAMAGERLHIGSMREISGVCTDPDRQGRGLARRLMHKLIRRQLGEGETPFLHVVRDNAGARGLYRRMGFRDAREVPVRVVART
jgi:GNAT superfamily N-acetyltransferase